MNIDYEKLRSDLLDYYGVAMNEFYPMAIMEVSKVEKASEQELIKIARKEHFNLDKYDLDQKKFRK